MDLSPAARHRRTPRRFKALATEYHVKTQFVSLAGEPVATLTRIAAAQRADAIILASHPSVRPNQPCRGPPMG